MKTTRILLFLPLLLCGCNQTVTTSPSPAPGNATFVPYPAAGGSGGRYAFVTVVTNSGHRFAVVLGEGHVGICEVTDASLVEAK
jgi:hypothetical protein